MADDFTEWLKVKRRRGGYNELFGALESTTNTGRRSEYESLHGGELSFALESIQASTRVHSNRKDNKQTIPKFSADFSVIGNFRYFKFERLIKVLSVEIVPKQDLMDGRLALRAWSLLTWENFAKHNLPEIYHSMPAFLYLPPNIFEQMDYFYTRDLIEEFSFAISVDKFDGIYGSGEEDFALLYDENQIDENHEEFSGMNHNGEYIFSCYQWSDENSNQRCEGPIKWLTIAGPKRTIKR